MGTDSSKPTNGRKRSGLSNVFAGGDCERTAGDTKSARELETEGPNLSEADVGPAKPIPASPVNCKPGRIKPPSKDSPVVFMGDVENKLTRQLLASGVCKGPVLAPSSSNGKATGAKSAPSKSVKATSAASCEVVALPAYRTTGVTMGATTPSRTATGPTPAPSSLRPKESGDDHASTTQGLTITSASATESPRITCEELLDGSSADKAAAPVKPNAGTAHADGSGTATQAVTGDVYFEALRKAWSAAPPPDSAAAREVAKLPPLAKPEDVGSPVDILHTINHQSSSYPNFKKPIPLGYMLEMLRPRWEDEGLYEQVEEQERYAQVEAARRAKHRR